MGSNVNIKAVVSVHRHSLCRKYTARGPLLSGNPPLQQAARGPAVAVGETGNHNGHATTSPPTGRMLELVPGRLRDIPVAAEVPTKTAVPVGLVGAHGGVIAITAVDYVQRDYVDAAAPSTYGNHKTSTFASRGTPWWNPAFGIWPVRP